MIEEVGGYIQGVDAASARGSVGLEPRSGW